MGWVEEGRGTTRSGGGAGKRRRLLGDGGRPRAGAAVVGFGLIWEQELARFGGSTEEEEEEGFEETDEGKDLPRDMSVQPQI